MRTIDKPNTVNVRIHHSTHEELKKLCESERMLIGGLVDKVLAEHIRDWKTRTKGKVKNRNTDK